LNAGRLGAPTTSIGILFQHLTTLTVKKFVLISSLKHPWAEHCAVPMHSVISYQGKVSSTSLYEWLGLEETSQTIQFQPSAMGRGFPSPTQAAQGSTLPGLEHLLG